MKDRDVEGSAMAGDTLPDGNGLGGPEPAEPAEPATETSEQAGSIRPIDQPGTTDASSSGRARRLSFGLPHRAARPRREPPAVVAPEQPKEAPRSAGKLQEYIQTRGVRGRVPSQARQVSVPQPDAADAADSAVSVSGSAAGSTGGAGVADAASMPAAANRRAAPHPLAPGRDIRTARPARQAFRPSLGRRIRRLGGSRASIAGALRHSSRRTAFGFAGALTTVALVGALVVVLPNHSTATPAPTGGSLYGVTWSAAGQPPTTKFDFGPYFTTTGSTLLMAGTTGSATTVWSSTDGSSWTQIADSTAFGLSGRRFVAQGMSGDGSGGLVIVGNSVGSGAKDVTATAWRSQNGHSWSQAQVNAAQGEEMIGGVAAAPGALVAAGNGIAWFSTDGGSWQPVAMPAAQAFIPREVGAWSGGFVIVSLASGSTTTRSAVWYSSTGRSWTQASTVLDGFDARGIAAVGSRVMVVGSDTSDTAEGLAVSWTSKDGNTWTKATAPSTQTTAAIDSVAAFDGSFVAVGSPDTTPGSTPAASAAPATEETWISDDGLGWLSLTTATTPVPRGHLSSVGNKLVLAGAGKDSVAVLTGAATLGPRRVATVSAKPAIVYSLDLTAGQVPMIPDVTKTDTLGPVVATSDRFVAFTTGGAGTSIWTSTDGGHLWAQEAKPAALAATGNVGRPVVLEAIQDGTGGVLAIGSVTNANGSTGTIWHRTAAGWHQVTIQDDAPPEFSSIAAGTNGFVASSDKVGGSSVMYSTDGETWYASAISVGEGFALTVSTYQYGFVAVGTNAARGGASAAWTSQDGRTWTLRTDWKVPPNVTALFGVGKYLVATSTVTPGVVAPVLTPAPSGSAAASATPAPKSKAKATPAPIPAATPGQPYTQWWWSGTGQTWQQTSLQTSSTNYAMVNDEIFAIDPPAGGATDWTTWSSSDGRTWIRPVSDPISFPGARVCALAALGNKLVIVGWQASGQLKGYFGKLTSQ